MNGQQAMIVAKSIMPSAYFDELVKALMFNDKDGLAHFLVHYNASENKYFVMLGPDWIDAERIDECIWVYALKLEVFNEQQTAEAERLRKELEAKAEAEQKERRYQAYLALKEEFEGRLL